MDLNWWYSSTDKTGLNTACSSTRWSGINTLPSTTKEGYWDVLAASAPALPVRKAGKSDKVEVLRTGRNDTPLWTGKRSEEMNKTNTKKEKHIVRDLTGNNLAYAGLYILACCFLFRLCGDSICLNIEREGADLEELTVRFMKAGSFSGGEVDTCLVLIERLVVDDC
ncbi:hypothetical protein SADUNF_Sadunf08G0157700 [Salix dunnii]|uniref:Uncharacterized protein n=1 Tax=Salix dunnii TaxID=1413687 RepID=A0A835MT51_9ROSI|nr:hypothetical protein SADUNF_Sadunf08G0157700 [Salix dunnii]